jgi:hypothetical protein
MLGSAVRIGASIWYASSRYAPAQALEMLSAKAKNPITIFDAVGGVASSEPRLVDRPPVARSWQERTLAEFLHA